MKEKTRQVYPDIFVYIISIKVKAAQIFLIENHILLLFLLYFLDKPLGHMPYRQQ